MNVHNFVVRPHRRWVEIYSDGGAWHRLTPEQAREIDLAEIQRMLAESGAGTPDELDRAASQAQGVGLLIRRLVGLDREAATDALSTFIAGRILTASQLDFVNLIITYLTEHGVMYVGRR